MDDASGTATDARPILLLLVHGIRTDAAWQTAIRSVLRGNAHVKVVPIKYGYLDLVRFWSPLFTRHPAIARVNTQLQSAIDEHPGHDVVVIAHSFGTYAISEILKSNRLIRINRLLLCGSIIPKDYDWDAVERLFVVPPGKSLRDVIINDCGCRDVWPVLAQSTTFGYGSSGTYGFGASQVTDRFHDTSHSGLFVPALIGEFWTPFVLRRDIAESRFETSGVSWPAWLKLFRLPYNYAACLALLLLAVLFGGTVFDRLYLGYGRIEEFRECGARILFPNQLFRRVRSDQSAGQNMLVHSDSHARIYLGTWARKPDEFMFTAICKIANRSTGYEYAAPGWLKTQLDLKCAGQGGAGNVCDCSGDWSSFETRSSFTVISGFYRAPLPAVGWWGRALEQVGWKPRAQDLEYYVRIEPASDKRYYHAYTMVHPRQNSADRTHRYYNVNELISFTLKGEQVLQPPSADCQNVLPSR